MLSHSFNKHYNVYSKDQDQQAFHLLALHSNMVVSVVTGLKVYINVLCSVICNLKLWLSNL